MRYRSAWALRAVAKLLANWADGLDPPKALLFGSLLRPFDVKKGARKRPWDTGELGR